MSIIEIDWPDVASACVFLAGMVCGAFVRWFYAERQR